ncbi:MAG TPA: sn-glycerol-3-phosphate ABC transporter permease UgpA [Spirochaetales bacterium]|mgnify:FL=1|nr:sn-glycerol-3-phosphate ABC transporter permease UgpA [Spirochaetales bacterium]HPG87366.1 sn-glycerol-3-phosphate ABC transporter permease UgpA [Spirochaetales bacterium]HPM73623.1 sn-glycerol-3-phosphate ABC transporter permease UgpA [Spirochaetales bacterium]
MVQQYEFKAKWLPYILVLPQMVIVFVFFFWPSLQGLWQSFFLQDPFGGQVIFVGLENYIRLFTDPGYSYGESFGVSVAFAVCVAALSMILALFLATQANKKIRFSSFYKTMMIWPYAVATMVAGVLWLFMFNPNVGIVAWFLKNRFGVEWQHLLNSGQAFLLVTLAASWKQISYNFVFFLAGLQSVPVDFIEAAAIDGAGPMRRFWKIIFPLLSPTTFYLLVMNLVYGFFETFPIIHQVTAGGPGKSTSILVYKVWRDGVINLDLGGSSAQSVILMIMVIGLTVVQFRFIERRVHY